MEKLKVYQQQTQAVNTAPAGYPAPQMQMGAQAPAMGYGMPQGYGMGAGPAAFGPTNVTPPVVSPTQQTVNTNVTKTVVPHIHPSHNTTVNKHLFQHQHYFPHTESVVNECYSQHLICGQPPVNPCCPPKHFGF